MAATVEFSEVSKAQWIVFGVAWVENYTEENRAHPWLVADPVGDRKKLLMYRFDKHENPEKHHSLDWGMLIESPWTRHADILRLFEGLEVIEHTNAEEQYKDLYEDELAVDVKNPYGGEDIWLEFTDEYTLGIGGWHTHYSAYEADYRMFKSDIRAILSGEMRLAVAFTSDNHWYGSMTLPEELKEERDGWTLLRAFNFVQEFINKFGEIGGYIKVVSWLPELSATYPVEKRPEAIDLSVYEPKPLQEQDSVITLVDKGKFPAGTFGIIVSVYSDGEACEVELWEDGYPVDVVTYLISELRDWLSVPLDETSDMKR